MKSVLFLAYLFPPISNSGTQRPMKFAKYLSDYGWRPTVITAARFDGHHVDASLAADLPAHVPVVRVPMLNEHVADTIARLTGGSGIGKRLGDAISWRVRARRTSPDMYALWKPMVMRAAVKLIEAGHFDAIYATGYPWSSLVTGCELSRATGCPLIADFRDLWAGETLFHDSAPPHDEQLRQERAVVECATTVVTASTSIARQLAAAHPAVDEEKFVAIHNGFDADDFAGAAPARDTNRFRIVFTGVWKTRYNPAELYDTIDWIRRSHPSLLDGVEIITAGFAPGEAASRGLSAYIEERGVVSHQDAVALMRSADILYLSHTDPERQWAVPGKVYEYLASGSPVLALAPPDKETGRIIARVGGGIAVSPDDPGTLLEVLSGALRHRRFDVPPRNADALASFERRQLTSKLASVLDDASQHVQVNQTALRMGARSSTVLATRSS